MALVGEPQDRDLPDPVRTEPNLEPLTIRSRRGPTRSPAAVDGERGSMSGPVAGAAGRGHDDAAGAVDQPGQLLVGDGGVQPHAPGEREGPGRRHLEDAIDPSLLVGNKAVAS